MEKRLKPAILSLIFINFISLVSAQFYSGYGGFSFRSFLEGMDGQMVVFFISLIIFFAILHRWIIGRLFRDDNILSAVISGALAFGMSYGIYKLDFLNLDRFLFSLGISSDTLWPIMVILILLLSIFLLWKFGYKALILIGLLFIGTSFTDIIYEKGAAFVIGLILIGIGIVWGWFSKKKSKSSYYRSKRKTGWDGIWILLGFILILVGILMGSLAFMIVGGVVILFGLFFWNRSKNKAREYGGKGIDFAKEKMDPSKRLSKYKGKRQSKIKKRLAKEKLKKQKAYDKAEKKAYREAKRRKKEGKRLRKRYKKIIKRLNSMPGGKNIKKGSPGYDEYIKLYREAEDIRKKLGL